MRRQMGATLEFSENSMYSCMCSAERTKSGKAAPWPWHVSRLTGVAILLLLILLLLRWRHAIPRRWRMLWPHWLRAIVSLHNMLSQLCSRARRSLILYTHCTAAC